MNPEQAKAAADMMITIWEGEVRGTAQVLAAVGKGNRDYRPDPKSRTAWQIATHIATADIWFIDSIIDGKFEWNEEGAKKVEAQFTDAAYLRAMGSKVPDIYGPSADSEKAATS